MNTSQSAMQIPLDQIQVSNRLRSIDPDHAALIAESFRINGQMTPIEVRRAADGGFLLVSGAHRLEAANIAGMTEVTAIIVEADDDQARLREIDENLCRRDLSELDRASFLAERKAVWLRMHPETGRGKRAAAKETNLSLFPTFARDVAEKLGVSSRSVDRAIRRHDALDAAVRQMLATSRFADNGAALDAIGKLPPAQQRAVAAALVRTDKPARGVTEALIEVAGRPRTPPGILADREYDRLLGAWRKAGKAARGRFLAFLADEGEIASQRDAA